MTNGDKIRNMTNEELVVLLKNDRLIRFCVAPNDEYCELVRDGLNPGFCDDDCSECLLNWLNEETQEEVENEN